MALLIGLYAALRWHEIDASCLWFDEMFSVQAAEQPWGNILGFIAADLVHPPLFYLLLKVWISAGGSGLLWARTLPFVFAMLTLVPFLLIARELKLNFNITALAVFLLSVSGVLINYTQRVRMYTMLMTVSLMSIWLFVRYLRTGKGLLPLILVNVIAIYTQYFGVFVIGCEVLIILLLYRQRLRGAIWLFATSLVAFAPWALTVVSAAQSGSDPQQNIGWILRPGPREVWAFIIDLIEPVYVQISSEEPASIYKISLPLLIVFITALVVFTVKFWRNEDQNRDLIVISIFAVLPIAIAFIASWVMPYSIWGTRHLIVCAGPLALAAAFIIGRAEVKTFQIAAVVLIMLFSGYASLLKLNRPRPTYLWCRWDELGTQFESSTIEAGRTRIYTFESIIAYHLWFASRNTSKLEPWMISGFTPMIENEVYFLPRGFEGVKQGLIQDIGGDRFWIVFRTHSPDEETPLFELMRSRGYSACSPESRRYGATNMFKVEFVKDSLKCSD